ncbi:hypothetical protein [Deinococcus aestuarii]|uniref:hypothetical protein n=1 Tax=Deinococcus aestuarii TaxID=2774531 RepID=UPI001C0DEF25|nr:hypothetical protein [Deinococcus aestuarii]
MPLTPPLYRASPLAAATIETNLRKSVGVLRGLPNQHASYRQPASTPERVLALGRNGLLAVIPMAAAGTPWAKVGRTLYLRLYALNYLDPQELREYTRESKGLLAELAASIQTVADSSTGPSGVLSVAALRLLFEFKLNIDSLVAAPQNIDYMEQSDLEQAFARELAGTVPLHHGLTMLSSSLYHGELIPPEVPGDRYICPPFFEAAEILTREWARRQGGRPTEHGT